MKFKNIFVCLLLLNSGSGFATEVTTLRIGVLAFGTVNWELTALQNEGLAQNTDFRLNIQHVANPQAGKIALQSGAVDMIVSDWIWVSRQRSQGFDLTFYPYSNTAGALLVSHDSPILKLQDLNGKRIGIAGGELDKNWLLLQALVMKNHQFDLNQTVDKIFAAPPLLNQQLIRNRVDAIINYWHYAARLEAQGFRQIINSKQILIGLGITENVPSLGYVFKQSWANKHRQAINRFFQASRRVKNILCHSDDAWEKIIPLTKAKSEKIQHILRQRYCEGRIAHWTAKQQKSANRIYSLLRKLSKNRLTGSSAELQSGTFWALE